MEQELIECRSCHKILENFHFICKNNSSKLARECRICRDKRGEIRQNNIKNGMCTSCRWTPATDQNEFCKSCSDKHNDRVNLARQKRRESGLCYECGKKLNGECFSGRCIICAERTRESTRK